MIGKRPASAATWIRRSISGGPGRAPPSAGSLSYSGMVASMSRSSDAGLPRTTCGAGALSRRKCSDQVRCSWSAAAAGTASTSGERAIVVDLSIGLAPSAAPLTRST